MRLIIVVLLISQISRGNIILPSVFSNHMVLQQQDDVKFWGWANPNENIVVAPSWTTDVYKTQANKEGLWELRIRTAKYGGPYTISLKGSNEIVLNDVLLGEVWLCSGQSNMEMSANWGIDDGDMEIALADFPNIRFFNVPKISSKTPQDNLPAVWEVCTSNSMRQSSALAYFFAKKLQEGLSGVPVGLINSTWGGTPAETWIPEDSISKDFTLFEAAKKLEPNKWGPDHPGHAFNAMIYPLIGYDIEGVLWYQGESNVGSTVYDKTLKTLITAWRSLWKNTFPFYFVQIAPYNYGYDNFNGVKLRDAQRRVNNNMDQTEMVIIGDVSPVDDIHPKDKKSVGFRLANMALTKHYKVNNNLVNSPNLKKVEVLKSKVVLNFEYGNGLYAEDKRSLFELAGVDEVFYPVDYELHKDSIMVWSKKVKQPKYVRFAWKNNQKSNLFNEVNLPVSSFLYKIE